MQWKEYRDYAQYRIQEELLDNNASTTQAERKQNASILRRTKSRQEPSHMQLTEMLLF